MFLPEAANQIDKIDDQVNHNSFYKNPLVHKMVISQALDTFISQQFAEITQLITTVQGDNT